MPTGKYSYPFQFQLPPNLPTSFEGEYGHVRYWVRASIEKPWKFDHMTKKAFTVVSALDLNSLPEANVSCHGFVACTVYFTKFGDWKVHFPSLESPL